MSTNYYMMTTNKELVNKYFDGEYEIVDDPYLGYQIHIGKRSLGWRPLFEAHENAYDSVSEMLEFITIHPEIHILDEYGKSLSITQLKEELIDWAECQEKKQFIIATILEILNHQLIMWKWINVIVLGIV